MFPGPSNCTPSSGDESLSSKLGRSKLFQDYQEAFESATGLPLNLRASGSMRDLGLFVRPGASPFCLLLAKTNQACAACYALQCQLEQDAKLEPRTLHCFAGLCESVVPVRVGEKIVAFLQTGQILVHRPDAKRFSKVAQTLIEMGSEVDLKKAEEQWFATTVLTETQYQSMLRLLHIFASHLSECANALSLEAQNAEPAAVAKAKAIIANSYEDEIGLATIARTVNVSAAYFSELFHKATGMTFTDYVARVRIEKVKHLLPNPRLPITTIAFDVGFKSLSQFNRLFKRHCGVSPKEYRDRRTVQTKT